MEYREGLFPQHLLTNMEHDLRVELEVEAELVVEGLYKQGGPVEMFSRL